jgi:hypothetical protein
MNIHSVGILFKNVFFVILILENLSRNQIVLILKENSKLTEKQILNWHKAFMKEQ